MWAPYPLTSASTTSFDGQPKGLAREFSSFRGDRLRQMMVHVVNVDDVWARIQTCAEQEFRTVTGIPFTYEVPGNYLRVHGIDRNLSRTNFVKAIKLMPADGPGQLQGRQGASYTWAILMSLPWPNAKGAVKAEAASAQSASQVRRSMMSPL